MITGKNFFSLQDDAHYLNCAYMAPLSKRVVEAGRRAMERLQHPSRIGVVDFFDPAMRVRRLFAEIINAPDPHRIAIIPAVSYGMATVARNTPLRATQHVVMVEEQFPSAVYTWHRACNARGASLRIVKAPTTSPSRGSAWNDTLLGAIDEGTAAVIIPEFHWTDGLRFDLKAIRTKTLNVGALLIVDGTQSIGAHPFDVLHVRPDALICAGYKWLTGPYGLGLAYFGEIFDDGVPLEENWIAREKSNEFADLVNYRDTYQVGAVRYDVGERANFVLLPMLEAALTQVLDWSPSALAAHSWALTSSVVPTLRSFGCQIEDEKWRAGHLLGVHLPASAEPQQIAETLTMRQISVSLRGTALRVSPYLYNDTDDMNALINALQSVMQ